MKFLYLCDRGACGKECPNELCFHTSKKRHAKNKHIEKRIFVQEKSYTGEYVLWEREHNENT